MIKMTSSQTFPIKIWFMTRIAIPMTKLVTNPTIAFAEINSPRVAGVMITADMVFKFTLEQVISSFIKVEREFYPDEKIREKYLDRFVKYKKIYNLISQIY
ncbi:unnamed protein product [marine sediment metagenome]|uniref:Uncharacterized protein n=1 Tax=marine sediment metagenome TaxID=412755 RepID=X0ZH41_9ZZZZ